MPEPLSLIRCRALAAAYGADLARWPEPERTAARALRDDPALRSVLDSEAVLDALLECWRVPRPDAALVDRITRSPPVPNLARGWRKQARLWWSAVGLAAALAGAFAGALSASAVAAAAGAPTDASTVFGDLEGGDN